MKFSLVIENLRKIIPFKLRNNFYLKKTFSYFFARLYLIRKLNKQLLDNRTFTNKKKKFSKKKVLVPLIETSHSQIHQILIIAKALEIRGLEVIVLVCNELLNACEIKTIKNSNDPYPCWECKYNLKHIIPIYKLKTIEMEAVCSRKIINKWIKKINKRGFSYKNIKDILPFEIDQIRFENIIKESVTRYFYGDVPIKRKVSKKLVKDNILTLLISSFIAAKIDKKWKPDIVLNNMFVYSSWSPFFEYYHRNGKRYNSINITPFNTESLIINSYDLYPSKSRYKKYLRSLSNNELSYEQNCELDNFLNTRFSGNSKVMVDDGYFKSLDLSNIKKKIIFDSTKRNIFLFSNIFWDVGISEMNYLYRDVIQWVKRSIELVGNSKSLNLYIKTHPAEKYDKSKTLKGVADIMRQEFGKNLPKNVFFIEPEMKIKPYDLFPIIDLGIIFSGTLGLEMMLNGKPVVTTGITPHFGLEFANEPNNEKDYELILKGKKFIKYPSIKEVRKFAYFYFIKSCIPWDLQNNAYGGYFTGFNFNSINDLNPGKNKYLDHVCNCLINRDKNVIENW